MEKIKKCPLCGNKSKVRQLPYFLSTGESGVKYRVQCCNLQCMLSNGTVNDYDTMDEAIREWNKRKEKKIKVYKTAKLAPDGGIIIKLFSEKGEKLAKLFLKLNFYEINACKTGEPEIKTHFGIEVLKKYSHGGGKGIG